MQIYVNIVVLASIYALISCGYVVIYRVSRVLNLAHGELMMLGAYLLLTTASSISSNPAVALAGAACMSVAVGLLVYFVLMRRMTGHMVLAAVLATIALGIFVRGVATLIWSAQQHYPARLLGITNDTITLLPDAKISTWSMVLVVSTGVIYIALFAFLRFSRWGIRMRAAGQNPLLAAQRGIDLRVIYAMAWAISTLTGSIAGILIAIDSGLDGTMVMIGLKAFPAALVGGLDSLAGALLGSLVIAGVEVFLIQHVDPLISDVVPFLILIAMLAVRPWGFFGTREELDRV